MVEEVLLIFCTGRTTNLPKLRD